MGSYQASFLVPSHYELPRTYVLNFLEVRFASGTLPETVQLQNAPIHNGTCANPTNVSIFCL